MIEGQVRARCYESVFVQTFRIISSVENISNVSESTRLTCSPEVVTKSMAPPMVFFPLVSEA